MKINSLLRPEETISHYFICSHPKVDNPARVPARNAQHAVEKFIKHFKLPPEESANIKVHKQKHVDVDASDNNDSTDTALTRAEKAAKKAKRKRRARHSDIDEGRAELEAIKRLLK